MTGGKVIAREKVRRARNISSFIPPQAATLTRNSGLRPAPSAAFTPCSRASSPRASKGGVQSFHRGMAGEMGEDDRNLLAERTNDPGVGGWVPSR